MTELSLCMIVKNEEERLARCLSGVQGAVDEIIIVDTGSTDGTKRVAGQPRRATYSCLHRRHRESSFYNSRE